MLLDQAWPEGNTPYFAFEVLSMIYYDTRPSLSLSLTSTLGVFTLAVMVICTTLALLWRLDQSAVDQVLKSNLRHISFSYLPVANRFEFQLMFHSIENLFRF